MEQSSAHDPSPLYDKIIQETIKELYKNAGELDGNIIQSLEQAWRRKLRERLDRLREQGGMRTNFYPLEAKPVQAKLEDASVLGDPRQVKIQALEGTGLGAFAASASSSSSSSSSAAAGGGVGGGGASSSSSSGPQAQAELSRQNGAAAAGVVGEGGKSAPAGAVTAQTDGQGDEKMGVGGEEGEDEEEEDEEILFESDDEDGAGGGGGASGKLDASSSSSSAAQTKDGTGRGGAGGQTGQEGTEDDGLGDVTIPPGMFDDPEFEDTIVGEFVSVKRPKKADGQWQVKMQNGVLAVGGKETFFKELTGTFDW
uniref:Transcription initiation factor IIA subunit 1 n=1 Tax=Chromera velia CCMP2878 TaxID=1169474 RepID=A0A0G4I1U2_9ALVE|eukprot:Cvel_10211.t1-p1 / transcript=Cvel_10211.t1 / gene=Cvel_10211 / organism=Chromera_velia_CCMP2878 / gene_product=hypothetical protein / transcript_product=hypothetical protein / location=Cvel_scaffold611:33251-36462(-) / protein_length=311 / sequence_SO=supercontig / SO=protein_coding / is_pseudo=false